MSNKDPLHGIKLQDILVQLEEKIGFVQLGKLIDIRCFKYDASIKSSLKFLRKTPWARQKVEQLYIDTFLGHNKAKTPTQNSPSFENDNKPTSSNTNDKTKKSSDNPSEFVWPTKK